MGRLWRRDNTPEEEDRPHNQTDGQLMSPL
jgi:hypothetical protein